jgi:hypothetical protein
MGGCVFTRPWAGRSDLRSLLLERCRTLLVGQQVDGRLAVTSSRAHEVKAGFALLAALDGPVQELDVSCVPSYLMTMCTSIRIHTA